MGRKLESFDTIIRMANEEYKQNGSSSFFKSLAQKVIDNQRPEENFIFANEVKGADPIAHGRVILEFGDSCYNYMYGMEIYGCDYKAHVKFLKDHNEYKLAKKLQDEHTPICEL